MAKIALDFDDTIHDTKNVKKGYKMGQPIGGAAEAIRMLRSQGHEIIIFPTWATSEARRKAIVDWLNYFGIEFDDITSVKPEAELYVDNRGLRFESWSGVLDFISKNSL